jgi:putative transposase
VGRRPRINATDAVYHVNTKGAAAQHVFRDDHDRRAFLALLAQTLATHRWECLSYCLMGTHYHVLVQTLDASISRGMHALNGQFARWHNRRHRLKGHVFEARFHAELVERQEHFLETMRYIALNPVRAGLCGRPEDWPWSSYAELVDEHAPPPLVSTARALEFIDGDPARARDHLRRFVAQGLEGDAGAAAAA